MGITVQHQPPLTALSELAFQTGQLQYRNQRRRELEAQQLAQAQMAQKERLAQMQVMANTQSQMRGHQQGMQRLAYQNMMGQQSQVGQHQLQMIQNAERAKQQRELANIYGENNVQAANMASENRMFERQQQAIKDMYDNVLNQQGQEALHGLLGQQQELKMSPDISPEEKQQQMEQIEQQIFQLREDPAMTLGRDQMPGAVRRKDEFFDEVMQQDGQWLPRLRTSEMVTLPDGTPSERIISLEELQQKAYKREEIDGTNTVRIRRLDPNQGLIWSEYDKVDTEKQQVEREKLNNIKLNSEAEVTKQVYADYQSFIGDREEGIFGDVDADAAPQMNMIQWLNSPDGALSKRLLERHGIEIDILDGQAQEIDPLGIMGEQEPVVEPQRPPERVHPDIVPEVVPRDDQGRIIPPTTELRDGTQIRYQPHDSTEAETPSEFNDSWENWTINFENWYRGLNDKEFGEKDELGNTYELGTIVRASSELGGQPEDIPITPIVIENVLREGGLEKDRIDHLIKLAKWRFEENYGETWEDWSANKGIPVAN